MSTNVAVSIYILGYDEGADAFECEAVYAAPGHDEARERCTIPAMLMPSILGFSDDPFEIVDKVYPVQGPKFA